MNKEKHVNIYADLGEIETEVFEIVMELFVSQRNV
jgi:hypothetical protein